MQQAGVQDYDDMLTAFKNYVEKNPVTQHKTQEKESILLNNHDYRTMDLTEQNAFNIFVAILCVNVLINILVMFA